MTMQFVDGVFQSPCGVLGVCRMSGEAAVFTLGWGFSPLAGF